MAETELIQKDNNDSSKDTIDQATKSSCANELLISAETPKITPAMTFFYSFCFFIFGINALLSWNAFITNSYFFKITVQANPNLFKFFESSLAICSFIPKIFADILNLAFWYKYREKVKVLLTFTIVICAFICITIIVSVKIKEAEFFASVMILSIIMNCCNPSMNSSLYNDLACFPPQCFTCFLAGQAFAGVFVSIIQLIITPINLDLKNTSVVYFAVALIVLVISYILYLIISKSTPYVTGKSKFALQHFQQSATVSSSSFELLKTYGRMFKRKWRECFGLFLTLAFTLGFWPIIPLQMVSTQAGTEWGDKYFISFATFLMFNVGDFLGRYTGSYLKWPKYDSIWMVLVPLSRVIFLFLFLLCYRPNSPTTFPRVFVSDAAPIIFVLVFGLINGHIITLAFGCPYVLETQADQKVCSILLVFVLDVGLMAGGFISFGLVLI